MKRFTMGILAVLFSMVLFGTAFAAELQTTETATDFGNAKSYGWQDREFFGASYVYRTLGGGDAAGDAGDGGAGATGAGDGGAGATGGNGDGCGR